MRNPRPVLLLLLALLVPALASASEPENPYRFWRPERRPAERELEAALLAVPEGSSLRAFHDLVCREPHVAGSKGDARVVEALVRALTEMGLEVERQDLSLYLARPLGAELVILSPKHVRLRLKEDVLAEDPWSRDRELEIGWNAYSGSGEVTAGVVYANYGRKEDFERLRGLGVEVKGRIVLARYGGSFRGYKARLAEEAGAAGLVIYTDPADGGYVDGPMYPEGGWAHPSAIQRGSLLTLPYPGDPLTPFVPATPEAERLDPSTLALPRIPIQPIGFRSAQEILSRMSGPAVPKGWQGGLPFAYRLTGGEALRVHLKVRQERLLLPSANVVATLRASRFPDQKVIVGSHHDAWTFGAADPNAGTIVVLEAARSFAEAAQRGLRPERSVVFANWAAEEFGILGSTEWVEAHRDELGRGAVAYVNLDSAALGLEVAAAASPSLKGLIADAARALPQPQDAEKRTVFEAWRARGEDPQRPGWPAITDLGGGSDHEGFLCHLGVASAGLSAGGSSGTAYHSAYDDLAWYRKVVGSDYLSALLVTRLVNLVAARLANADLLPLDPTAYGLEAVRHATAIEERARSLGITADLGRLKAAARHFETRSRGSLGDALSRLEKGGLDGAELARANDRLLRAERLWLLPGGLPGRPWFRSLWAAPDEDSGYAASMLPALQHALERRDAAELEAAERQVIEVFSRLEDEAVSPLSLDARVQVELAGFPGRVSLFARNLDTGESYALRPDERVRAASTIKIPIMVEAFARVEEGSARWDEPLVFTEAGKAAGAGVLPELGEGLRLTLRDAVRLMIVASDNTATNLVLDRFTAEAVNARLDTLGFRETRCLKKIGGGGASQAAEDPANTAFGIGVTTPREMETLVERLARGEIVSPSASREMIELLKREQLRAGIGRRLRLPAATKSGALDRLRSDVGVLYTPGGRIAMAITAEDLPEVDYTVDNPAQLLLWRLSRDIVEGLGAPAASP